LLSLVELIDGPLLVHGHSSGGPVALESLLASPMPFASGVIYKPASVIGSPGDLHLAYDRIPRDREVGQGLRRARAALAAGKPGAAMGIFTSTAAGWPGWVAHIAGSLVALIPAYRRLIPCQIDDLEAMERLGVRLNAYSAIHVLVGEDRSPRPLQQIVAAVAHAIPGAKHVVLHGQGHDAHVRTPERLQLSSKHTLIRCCNWRGTEDMGSIVFVEMLAFGHINPSLPLARELVRGGERVIYFNDAEFSQAVSEGSGAEFRPVFTWSRDLSDDRSGNADR
jgi:Alpha/beta hydrolase family